MSTSSSSKAEPVMGELGEDKQRWGLLGEALSIAPEAETVE